MNGTEEMLKAAQATACEIFPLGAGGGGAVLVFADKPDYLEEFKQSINAKYDEIPFKIKSKGHELINPM
jgi:D-glycero-alpha-D-manno-heptose-7-phosphate kinase